MKPLGAIIGNLKDGYRDTAPERTPASSSSRTSIGSASSSAMAKMPPLKPMSLVEAAELVDKLLREYPNLNAHDPAGYITALGEIMQQFPQWVGAAAIEKMASANPDFPPTGPRLRAVLSEIMRPYRYAVDWNAGAAKQLAEREREIRAAPPAPRQAT